jgi:hypothetical protein
MEIDEELLVQNDGSVKKRILSFSSFILPLK